MVVYLKKPLDVFYFKGVCMQIKLWPKDPDCSCEECTCDQATFGEKRECDCMKCDCEKCHEEEEQN